MAPHTKGMRARIEAKMRNFEVDAGEAFAEEEKIYEEKVGGWGL